MTQAGKLRHRLQIQRAVETNVDGDVTRAWTTLDTRWGSVEPLTGKELYEAQQVQPRAAFKVMIRYYDGLLTSDRFREVTVTDGDGSGSGSSAGDDIDVNLTLNIEHIKRLKFIKRDMEILCSEDKG